MFRETHTLICQDKEVVVAHQCGNSWKEESCCFVCDGFRKSVDVMLTTDESHVMNNIHYLHL